MPTLTDIEPDDPQACADCIALAELCDFHRGIAVGWDLASAVVGRFVALVPKPPEPREAN